MNGATAPLLAFITAWIRAWNEGKSAFARWTEGSLLGLATVAVFPVLELLGLSQNLAVFFGVCMGFVGVETLKLWLKRFVERKIGKGGKK